MKITDLLRKDGIALGVDAADQNAAIDKLIELHSKVGNLKDAEEFKKAILAREEKGSTAVGMGIAVPHGKSAAVATAGVTAMTIPAGIDYKSLDGNPSKLFFMIAAPDTAADTHLEVLSKLMTLLMDQSFSQKLIDAKTADEFLDIIDKKEAAKDAEEAQKRQPLLLLLLLQSESSLVLQHVLQESLTPSWQPKPLRKAEPLLPLPSESSSV